tara:strand:- start:19 stop:774 length:756 start_codon:yes stop_codon:yes gene_type:complete
MTFGKNYSLIYDLLYKDKDYKKEANTALRAVKKFKNKFRDLLEIGCGSGNFTKILAKKGYLVTAIDPSSQMIKIAKKKVKSKKIKFLNIKSTKFKTKKKFDLAISLFHVFSYHTKKKEINLFFKNLSNSLNHKGILIFDFWFKPAVLSIKPEKKIKIVENRKYKIIRRVTPQWNKKSDIVISNYHVQLINKKNKKKTIFKEKHKTRFFSLHDVKQKLQEFGFKYKFSFDILSNMPVSRKTWGATVIAVKQN